MTPDDAINQAAAMAAYARRACNEDLEAYWTERVVRLSDAREHASRCATFDVLKGSPDHSAGFHERSAHA